jgi:hypothetical protein
MEVDRAGQRWGRGLRLSEMPPRRGYASRSSSWGGKGAKCLWPPMPPTAPRYPPSHAARGGNSGRRR